MVIDGSIYFKGDFGNEELGKWKILQLENGGKTTKKLLSYLQPALLPKTLTEINSGREGSFPPLRPLYSISQFFLRRKKKKTKTATIPAFAKKVKNSCIFPPFFSLLFPMCIVRENSSRTIWHEDIIFFCFIIPFTTRGKLAMHACFLSYTAKE